jgi:glycine/D-amino acid oxidase-like deaminating enzyme
MEIPRHVDKLEIDAKKTRVVVIGGGVLGLMAGIEAAKLNIGKVELFDAGGERATDAAGAQFMPFAAGLNSELLAEEKDILPFDQAYLPCILQGYEESRDDYDQWAQAGAPGVTRTPLMELVEPRVGLNPILRTLMEMQVHSLGQTRELEGEGGKRTSYSHYYACESFAIDTLIAHAHLRSRFEELGGIWHDNTYVSREAVQTVKDAFVVVAAGDKFSALRPYVGLPFQKKRGMSATFHTDDELPQLPMLSYADIVFRPHADRHGITVGGLNLDHYGHDENLAKQALMRRLNDVEEPIGPWTGLPLEMLHRHEPTFRFGTRAMGMNGLSVEQDHGQPNVFHIEGGGSVGWSLAPWAAKLVARFIKDTNEHLSPRVRDKNALLVPSDEPLLPYLPRTSREYMRQRPSRDFREWAELVKKIDETVLSLVIARGYRELRKAQRDIVQSLNQQSRPDGSAQTGRSV